MIIKNATYINGNGEKMVFRDCVENDDWIEMEFSTQFALSTFALPKKEIDELIKCLELMK